MDPATAPRIDLASRWLPAALGLVAMAALAALYAHAPDAYSGVLRLIGIVPNETPFLDTRFVLAAEQCWQLHVDIYAANPCDPLGRVYDYSPLIIDMLPGIASPAWTNGAGVAIALAFFGSLTLLPGVRSARELVLLVMACLSTMVVYALERGNLDALVLALMIGMARLAAGPVPGRWSAYPVTLFATFLKLYPATALILIARESWRHAVILGGVALAAIGTFVVWYRDDLLRAVHSAPAGFSFTDSFAAANLPQGMAYLVSPALRNAGMPGWLPAVITTGLLVLLLVQAAVQAIGIGRRIHGASAAALTDLEACLMIAGSALIVGCFFSGFSIQYRGVHFLLVLPALFALARGGSLPGGYRILYAIVFLMWGECFRQAIVTRLPDLGLSPRLVNNLHAVFWLIRELVWWRVIAVLAGVAGISAWQTRGFWPGRHRFGTLGHQPVG